MHLLIISTIILKVTAGLLGANLAKELGDDVVHLRIPRGVTAEFLYRIAGYPTEGIKSYRTDSLLLNGYHLRLSEAFKNSYVHSLPPTYEGHVLVEDLPTVVFKAPDNAAGWGYGEERFLESKDFVKVNHHSRVSRKENWISSREKTKVKLTVLATKYKDAEGHDVVLIEKVVKAVPRNAPYSLWSPNFHMGDHSLQISEAVAKEAVIVDADHAMRAGYEVNSATMVMSKANFKTPADMGTWELGETRILKSDREVKVKYRFREDKDHPWSDAVEHNDFVSARVTRYAARVEEKDKPVKDTFVILQLFTPRVVDGQFTG